MGRVSTRGVQAEPIIYDVGTSAWQSATRGRRRLRGQGSASLLLLCTLAAGAADATEGGPYYDCLATAISTPDGRGGLATERIPERGPATPRFGVDLRNGAIFGSVLEGFGTGELLIRQPGPGELWAAYWILRTGRERRVDILQLVPPAEPGRQLTFLASHRDRLYTGFCVALPAAATLPGR